ncbi:MAG: TIGR01777 family oxidoreductase [Bacteriovoracaceae bacterium]|nr:TIGR01777 family oxidoreductase [Bacteroidota bacterium]
MRILITGGTGFIGSAVIKHLSIFPHDLVLLTRGESRMELRGALTVKYVHWDPTANGIWERAVNGCDVVLNLVGKNVFEQRWNETVKRDILNSRIIPTTLLVEAIGKAEVKPKLLISASAVGYYGNRLDEMITESSSGGDDFLADVVKQWEGAAYQAEQFGVRVATPRIGLVLEKSGGMIGKMRLPFTLFAGGPIGTGKQFLPWIHIEDVVRGILYPMENEQFRSVYNLVSPYPVTMKEFAKAFGSVLHRPSWLPVPHIALDILYGEGANVILAGQKAYPEKLRASGYEFAYPELRSALENIMQ